MKILAKRGTIVLCKKIIKFYLVNYATTKLYKLIFFMNFSNSF